MPAEFLKEWIGLVCEIIPLGGEVVAGELIAVEGNWLKVDQNGTISLINGGLVRSISAMPEKYQEKYREKKRKQRER